MPMRTIDKFCAVKISTRQIQILRNSKYFSVALFHLSCCVAAMVRHVPICLLCLLTSSLCIFGDVRPEKERGYDHVVYVGDSILRYQMLTFLYQIHHHKTPPSNISYNEGHSILDATHKQKDWLEYMRWSTSVFNGHMKCDCYRGPVLGKTKEIVENRFYSHPNGIFFASYFLKYGDSDGA